MKRIFKLSLFLFLFFFSSVSVFSQKFGHLNFGNLISLMPETESANSELDTYQKQLVSQGEQMAIALEAKFQKYVKQAEDLAPKVLQEKEAELQKERNDILRYEQEVMQKVEIKRQELLNPIVEKAQKAIAEVAKANNYQFVFDTSMFNAVLFSKESDDLLPLVKTKLGL